VAVIPAQNAHRRETRLAALFTGFWKILDGFVSDRMRRTAAEAAQIRPRRCQPGSSSSNNPQ
jgi:hypothetical protein